MLPRFCNQPDYDAVILDDQTLFFIQTTLSQSKHDLKLEAIGELVLEVKNLNKEQPYFHTVEILLVIPTDRAGYSEEIGTIYSHHEFHQITKEVLGPDQAWPREAEAV